LIRSKHNKSQSKIHETQATEVYPAIASYIAATDYGIVLAQHRQPEAYQAQIYQQNTRQAKRISAAEALPAIVVFLMSFS